LPLGDDGVAAKPFKAIVDQFARGRRALHLHEVRRLLLDLIIAQQPNSLAELEALSGRAKSNLSRTLKSMERFGLVELLKGEGGTIRPRVPYEEIKLDLPMAHRREVLASPSPH
jgi:predicted transcriptional regulator